MTAEITIWILLAVIVVQWGLMFLQRKLTLDLLDMARSMLADLQRRDI